MGDGLIFVVYGQDLSGAPKFARARRVTEVWLRMRVVEMVDFGVEGRRAGVCDDICYVSVLSCDVYPSGVVGNACVCACASAFVCAF